MTDGSKFRIKVGEEIKLIGRWILESKSHTKIDSPQIGLFNAMGSQKEKVKAYK